MREQPQRKKGSGGGRRENIAEQTANKERNVGRAEGNDNQGERHIEEATEATEENIERETINRTQINNKEKTEETTQYKRTKNIAKMVKKKDHLSKLELHNHLSKQL